ncbi:MAG TPA: DUF6306 domain-containing protein [Syntrophorhabdaceae bacterium]|jgi:nitronate monooxygenase
MEEYDDSANQTPAYKAHMNQDLVAFYNRLLEAERAGVQTLNDLSEKVHEQDERDLLKKFLLDEGMNCQILTTFIRNSGGKPTSQTGDFVDKIRALNTIDEKLRLLVRGQEWVAKYIQRNRGLPLKASDRMFLEAMKIQHEENVDNLKRYVDSDDEAVKRGLEPTRKW